MLGSLCTTLRSDDVICSSENFSPQVGVEGEEELVAVLEFYTGLGLIAYWGQFFGNES